jgi:hypothetical protein
LVVELDGVAMLMERVSPESMLESAISVTMFSADPIMLVLPEIDGTGGKAFSRKPGGSELALKIIMLRAGYFFQCY